MLISFFEEYPTKENLSKLKLINFPTKLYIASASLKEFQALKIKNKHLKEIIYWPTLKRTEGYWYSPFSNRTALLRTLKEIPNNLPVMLDLELPTTQNSKLYLTQLLNFTRNKRLISKFIKDHKDIYTAEYFPNKTTLKLLGLNYNPQKYNNKVIKMFYTSMWPFPKNFLDKRLKDCKTRFQSSFIPALGTIATGEAGTEPLLSLKNLERDLKTVQNNKIKEVIIFRLGGLTKEYIEVLSKFT